MFCPPVNRVIKMRFLFLDELVHATSGSYSRDTSRRRLFDPEFEFHGSRGSRAPVANRELNNYVFPISLTPPISIEHFTVDARGDETQHSTYLIPIATFPKRAGSWLLTNKLTFEAAELFVMRMFPDTWDEGYGNIFKTNDNKNRNIDLQRVTHEFSQSIEVKLTSGFYHRAPGIIKSSIQQLQALLKYKNNPNLPQLIPSLYAIVSDDYLKDPVTGRSNRYATVWFIPVYNEDDFVVLKTARQAFDGTREIDVRPRVKEHTAYTR